MNDTSAFLARVLDRGTPALAAYAAGEFLESRINAKSTMGSVPLSGWQNWLSGRLKELAAAVAANDSRIFTGQVRWATALLATRGFSTEHLRASLKSLQAVLARELPETVRPLAVEYLDRALSSFHEGPAQLPTELTATTPESRLAAEYLLAVLDGDRGRASRLILDAVDAGYSVADVLVHVLLPAQVEIGRMWHADEINVAEEHLVTTTTKMVMAQLMTRVEFRPRNGKTMLAAAVAGNLVDIGLQAVADFFEMDGWRTIQLGANVPTRDIAQAVEFFDADLLGLSASQSTQFETVRETIQAVRSMPCNADVKIIVGGFAFAGSEHLPRQLGADGYAPDPVTAVELGARLVCGTVHQAD